ncbi:MAG: ATP-binding protein [Pyrinomonadaceae bacterium]
MSNTALSSANAAPSQVIEEVITREESPRRHELDGRRGVVPKNELTTLVTAERFAAARLRASLNGALAQCPVTGVEIVSAVPEWLELKVPCDLGAIELLQRLITELDADLPEELGEAISYAFREMLSNAVEYGGGLDASKRVEIRFIRLKRAIICRIKDPGTGFDPTQVVHAAINNPTDDPLRHASFRQAEGLGAGGFGILLTSQLVDELVYNEQHNELLFVKYLF